MMTSIRNALARASAAADGEHHYRILKALRKSQYLDAEQLQSLQLEKLRKLLRHAYENVPYYREMMARVGIAPDAIERFDDLSALPLLTKSAIQQHREGLIAQNYPRAELVPDLTGGSTGKPLHFYHDREHMDFRRAAELRHNEWAGWSVGRRLAVVWGARRDLNTNPSLKEQVRSMLIAPERVLDSSCMTDENMSEFADTLARFKPWGILAYAESLLEFAIYLRASGKSDIRPHSIITSAEVLETEARQFIEATFSCPVFDRYGCRELAVVASECEAHKGLHIAADCLIVEVLREDGTPAAPGELGQIVVTDLNNFGMPFIRYAIEDAGALSDSLCSCGRTLPLLERIRGRATDFIVRPDGTRVAGPAIGQFVMVHIPGILQSQIVQDRVDGVTLRLVKGPDYSERTLTEIQRRMPAFLGNMSVDYEFVDAIPRAESGKFKYTINQVRRKHAAQPRPNSQ